MVKIFDKIRYKKFKTKNEFKETIDENIVVNDDLDSGWSYGFGISINKLHEIVVMVIHSQIYRKSGIKLGDIIISIDGFDLNKVDNVDYLLRGEKGSLVKLEILDPKTGDISNHTLTRDINICKKFNIKTELVKLS